MFMPYIPVELWNVLGENHVRLSQPTHFYSGGTPYFHAASRPLCGPLPA